MVDLLGRVPCVVGGQTALQMQQFGGVLAGHTWERYGLGLMWLPLERYALLDPSAPGAEPFAFCVGHNGCDYGTWTHSCYSPALDVGLSIMLNKEDHLLVDGEAAPGTRGAHLIFCRIYRALFRWAGAWDVGQAALRACAPV
jgi:hypothetical protein